jgi:hypothetical protein
MKLMRSIDRPRASRRGIVFLALSLATAFTMAARPASPGVTFRMRMVVTPPDMPGMTMAPTVVVGHGVAVGAQSRFDIDSVSGQVPLAIGDYTLMLDSGRIVSVSPSAKTYSEGMPMMAQMPMDLLAQASVTNVNVTTEKLGAGEPMQGFPTEKVRMTATYTIGIPAMGASMNTMNVMELSMAKLPASIATPFDGSLPKELADGPMKELAEKMNAARKALGSATPLKTVTTSSVSVNGMNIQTTTSVEMLDVKAADVDPALLKVPEGFTKKP